MKESKKITSIGIEKSFSIFNIVSLLGTVRPVSHENHVCWVTP
nr:MAG TPA_asm: hypothetical protein [Caudoviricetes sp.]